MEMNYKCFVVLYYKVGINFWFFWTPSYAQMATAVA